LAFQIKTRGAEGPKVVPDFTPVGDDKVIGSTVWQNEQDERVERSQEIAVAGTSRTRYVTEIAGVEVETVVAVAGLLAVPICSCAAGFERSLTPFA
jgi:hypothetical protein